MQPSVTEKSATEAIFQLATIGILGAYQSRVSLENRRNTTCAGGVEAENNLAGTREAERYWGGADAPQR